MTDLRPSLKMKVAIGIAIIGIAVGSVTVNAVIRLWGEGVKLGCGQPFWNAGWWTGCQP